MINPRTITLCWRKRQKSYLFAAKRLTFVRKYAIPKLYATESLWRVFYRKTIKTSKKNDILPLFNRKREKKAMAGCRPSPTLAIGE